MDSADGQQLFVESADLPCPIYEVNFKYPVPLSARSVRQPHPVVILGVDIKSDLVSCDLLMRKNTNQMARNGTAIFPASLFRQLLRVRIELGCGDLGMFVKMPLAAGECLFDITAEFVLQRIVSYNVSPPEVGLPFPARQSRLGMALLHA